MMRPQTLLAPIAALTLFTLLPPPAEARSTFHFGSGFRIGGFHFHIGYHHRERDHYYRTRHHLSSHRYRCTDRCYVKGGYNYHHRRCPVVRSHFYRYGYDPHYLLSAYGPRYDRDRYYSEPAPSYRYRDSCRIPRHRHHRHHHHDYDD